jgi:hypothetical protein
MVWKEVTPIYVGDATLFGGDDINKISQLFNGVLNVDTVDINSNFTFRSGKARLRNPADTFSYIINTGAILADRTLTIPVVTANDTFAVLGLGQNYTAMNTVNITAVGSTAETLARWRVSDDAVSDIELANASATDGVFVPWWKFYNGSTVAHPGLYLYSYIGTGLDTGAVPALIFDIRKADNTAIVTRPFFEWRNAGTDIFTISTAGFDFKGADILNAGFDQANGNTLSNVGDANIAAHTTTKITTTSKSLLNTAIVYDDQNNSLGDHYLDIGDIAVPANPAAGIRRLFTNTTTGELSVRTSGGTTVSLEATGGTYDHFDSLGTSYRYGEYYAVTSAGRGLLASLTSSGTGSGVNAPDATDGHFYRYTTTAVAGGTGGIRVNLQLVMRQFNPKLKWKQRISATTNVRAYSGFTSSTASFPGNNDDPLNAASGILVGKRVGDTTWHVCHNDGAGVSAFTDTTVAVGTTPVRFEIIADNAVPNFTVYVNGTLRATLTTDIPAATTSIQPVVCGITNAASAITVDTFWVYIRSDK